MKNDPFASLFADTHTIGRQTGSNWVDPSQFWQLSIVPGAMNKENDGRKVCFICSFFNYKL